MLARCIGKIQAQIYEKAFFVASFGSLYPELGPEGGELKIKNEELKIKNASSFISSAEAQQAERGPLSNETSDPKRSLVKCDIVTDYRTSTKARTVAAGLSSASEENGAEAATKLQALGG